MKNMINITSLEQFDREVVRASQPMVVDIFAPWCGPCKVMAPIFEQVAAEKEGLCGFAKVNIEEVDEIASQYGVFSIPTFLFFHNGKMVGNVVGSFPRDVLIERINEFLGV